MTQSILRFAYKNAIRGSKNSKKLAPRSRILIKAGTFCANGNLKFASADPVY